MSNKSPIFPMPDPQHFSDYGFDPQFNYFQVLEEAMKHKRDTERSIDSIRFKLQKPQVAKAHTKKLSWWKNLFKWRWAHQQPHHHPPSKAHQPFRASISGPVYMTDSRNGPTSPHGRPSSGPLAGTLTPVAKGEQQQRMSTSALPLYLVS